MMDRQLPMTNEEKQLTNSTCTWFPRWYLP